MKKLVFSSLEQVEQSFGFLDVIPDTHAWVKNAQGQFVCGNRLFFERFGFRSMAALVGRCDADIAPSHLAEQYTADDAMVLQGGIVTDRLELILGPEQSSDWFLTSKRPIYDSRACVLGTFGFSRHLKRTESAATSYQELRAPVDYISQNFSDKLSVQSLADACSLSVSALERRFRKHLNKTPRQYIIEVRLEHAKKMLLETDKPVGRIALETGFADHSHLTRAFSARYGLTPSETRRSSAVG
ncbi:MAG: helix-turn-helix domain-containing protein [Pseudomonadota bacterium]